MIIMVVHAAAKGTLVEAVEGWCWSIVLLDLDYLMVADERGLPS